MCVCVCVCVCVYDNSKINRSRKVKLEYIVEYENISNKFDNGHCRIKVKVTTIQTISQFYNSTLVQARKLILTMYVHLIITHNFDKYHHD